MCCRCDKQEMLKQFEKCVKVQNIAMAAAGAAEVHFIHNVA